MSRRQREKRMKGIVISSEFKHQSLNPPTLTSGAWTMPLHYPLLHLTAEYHSSLKCNYGIRS